MRLEATDSRASATDSTRSDVCIDSTTEVLAGLMASVTWVKQVVEIWSRLTYPRYANMKAIVIIPSLDFSTIALGFGRVRILARFCAKWEKKSLSTQTQLKANLQRAKVERNSIAQLGHHGGKERGRHCTD